MLKLMMLNLPEELTPSNTPEEAQATALKK